MSFWCTECNIQFKTCKTYTRHKTHSCKFNPARKPRIDGKKPITNNPVNSINQTPSAETNQSSWNQYPSWNTQQWGWNPTQTWSQPSGPTWNQPSVPTWNQSPVPTWIQPPAPIGNQPPSQPWTQPPPPAWNPQQQMVQLLQHIFQQPLAPNFYQPVPIPNNMNQVNPIQTNLQTNPIQQSLAQANPTQTNVIQTTQVAQVRSDQLSKTDQTERHNLDNFPEKVLEEKVLEKLDNIGSKIDNQPINTNVFNIEKIQIYVTDSIDFVEVLTKRFGSRKKAIDHIRSKIHRNIEGDVELFCEIYLNGTPDTWPISCPDQKNKVFRIAQPDSKTINDPGGVEIHKRFRNIYANTLLRLSNSAIHETLSKIPGTPEYEESRDNLLDSYELGKIQEKAHDLCKAPTDPFIKKLAVKFKSLERSHELSTTEVD